MPGLIRWLEHRDAINCRGKRFDKANWTGREHMAFGPVAYNRDTASILAISDDLAAEVYQNAVQTGIDEAQGTPVIEAGPPCETCGKPSARVIAGKNYCGEHGKPQPVPDAPLKKHIGATAAPAKDDEAIKRAQAEFGREILLEQHHRDYEPERAARDRLLRQYGALRDDVFKGKVRVGARWPGQTEIRPLLLNQLLPDRYPSDPSETKIELPSLPLPMTLVFSEADILALKGTKTGRAPGSPGPQRLSERMAERHAKQFLASRQGQNTTQDDLWTELRKHGHCPRSVMRTVAKACGLPGRGRPRSKSAAGD